MITLDNMKITRREKEVLICLAEGLTTDETASQLFISHETVKRHRSNLLQKLKARNAFQLGIEAIRHGLLSINAKCA